METANQLKMETLPDQPVRRTGSRWFFRQLSKKRSAQIGGAVVALLIFFALFAPFVVPYDPFELQTEIRLTPPNREHPLGTDELGRDLLSRILYGTRYTVMIGLIVTGIGCGGGFLIGLTAAYWGGWVDMLAMRLIDIMLSFPYILLSLAGHPDAHEKARVLSRQSRIADRPLVEIIDEDRGLDEYLDRLAPEQRAVLKDPGKYIGATVQRTIAVCEQWERRLPSILASIRGSGPCTAEGPVENGL